MKTSKDDGYERIDDHEALILITILDKTRNIWTSVEGRVNAQKLMDKLIFFRMRIREEHPIRKE